MAEIRWEKEVACACPRRVFQFLIRFTTSDSSLKISWYTYKMKECIDIIRGNYGETDKSHIS
ncbi:MAG: hypothetical protein FD174_4208 [Geobacteraceae bacterium]|nr:MAG: hypothetical protein FD174_4208 [Geobacteraceae bacterium]